MTTLAPAVDAVAGPLISSIYGWYPLVAAGGQTIHRSAIAAGRFSPNQSHLRRIAGLAAARSETHDSVFLRQPHGYRAAGHRRAQCHGYDGCCHANAGTRPGSEYIVPAHRLNHHPPYERSKETAASIG